MTLWAQKVRLLHVGALRWNYMAMVRSLAPLVFEDAPYLYQREPNLRVQLPGETAVIWHTDAEKGHQKEIWNVWVPLTSMTDDSQRLWIDEGHGLVPVRIQPGQAAIFRGGVLRHGNRPNATRQARVSLDFRLLARREYEDTGRRSIRYGVPLSIGEYWAEP